MTNKKPLIAAIQETRFLDSDADNYSFTLPGYSAYFHNVNSQPRRGGTALYVSNQLLHYQLNVNSNLNHVAVNVKLAQQNINVISIYLTPTEVITAHEIDNFFTQIPTPSLVLGDFNAHHVAWGCLTNDTRGNILNNILDDHQMVFLNDTTPTLHSNSIDRGDTSVIDLVIATPRIAPFFVPEVQTDIYFSDHYPIHIKIGAPSNLHNQHIPKWNFKKANWNNYKDYLEEAINNDGNVNIEQFLNVIIQAANNNIPLTRPRKVDNHAPWWNLECKHAVAKRRRALKAFKRCICDRHHKEAIETRREAKKVILKAKRDSWEQFSNKFNRFTPLGEIWKLIRCFKLKRKPNFKIPHLLIDNTHYTTPLDVANQFAAHFARTSSSDSYTDQQHNALSTTLATCTFNSDNNEHYNHLYTIKELQFALSKCGNTSVGPDQLAYPFFQNLTESGLEILLKTLNELWVEGTFPDSWRHSTLIPIPKSKKDPNNPSSYRPISLNSCASKIFERMVNNRIRVYLESNQKLTTYQNGFRPGRSTSENLMHIIDSVKRGFTNNNVTAALFLDLKAAFDKVHHDALLIKLYKIGVRGRLATYIKNFITNRTFSVRCGNVMSGCTAQDHGIPQGSPLSPTLFLIFINDVFENLPHISPLINFSLYADDLAIWYTHPSIDRANEFLQLALNSIEEWCHRWGVTISPAKSATMVFSVQRLHLRPHTPLHLREQIIPFVTNFKYLGLTLDRRLTFNVHIEDLKKRCSRRLNVIKCLTGREWGSDRCTLLRLYISLIRPILEYNAFLFGDISCSMKAKLESIQNNALRVITGAFKTTPITNLYIETNIPSLERRREVQLMRYFVRSASRTQNLSFNIFSRSISNLQRTAKYKTINVKLKEALTDYKIDPPNVMDTPPLRPFWLDKDIETIILFSDPKSTISPLEIQEIFHDFKEEHEDFQFIYTDGSKSNNRTGAAFVHKNFTQSFRLSDIASIYSAELNAILAALRYTVNKQFRNVIICSDSRAAIFALSSLNTLSNPIVNKIRDIINGTNQTIKFLWIPGHTGIHGNDRADLAAKQSLNDPPQNQLPNLANDCINVIRAALKATFQLEWNVNPHFHFHPIKPEVGYWPSANQNTRKKETLLARLRMGHTKITHAYMMEGNPPTPCLRCGCRYNVKHMLLECPQYNLARQQMIKFCNNNQITFNLPNILGNDYPDLLELLFTFLHETKLENFI